MKYIEAKIGDVVIFNKCGGLYSGKCNYSLIINIPYRVVSQGVINLPEAFVLKNDNDETIVVNLLGRYSTYYKIINQSYEIY